VEISFTKKNPMTLNELIHRHHWLSIQAELVRLYPEEEEQIDSYSDVYYQLKLLTPEPSDITIRIKEIIDDDETYISVDGYYTDGRVDEQSVNDTLGLDFTPWNKWLGMPIDKNAFEEFSELEIIAHCLFEMTFVAFDQEEIQEYMDDLRNRADEFEKMTPEERKKNTTTLEDLLKELDEEKEGDDESDPTDQNKK
jgi:hypothetical protein